MRRPTREQLRLRWVSLGVVVAVLAALVTYAITAPDGGTDDDALPSSTVAPEAGTDLPAPVSSAPSTTTLESTGVMLPDPGRPGPVVGDGGTIHTYRVEVEQGAGVDPAAFATEVERILSDPRGWTVADGIRLQRVTDPEAAELIISLATPDTVDLLCYPLDTDGEVSCAQAGHAILNARRWHDGAPPAQLSLVDYRTYLVGHELGHTLGHAHVGCPAPGTPAPVMMQQTLGIGDCRPNPWPAPDARAG